MNNSEAFVWIWLPDSTEPVVSGKLKDKNGRVQFNYGRSYLERDNAIAIFDTELPLKSGNINPLYDLTIAGCIRDGAPDAWGRRVIANKLTGANAGYSELTELTYLLESSSDRIGALDFQRSSTNYEPRTVMQASLYQLQEAAERVVKGLPLNSDLDSVILRGSSVGGARPKMLTENGDRKFIAKFSFGDHQFDVAKAEYIAMRLAKYCDLNVAQVSLMNVKGKSVLLVERFDRNKTTSGWTRQSMISALTLFELDEMMARYASYQELAEIIRHKFIDPSNTLKELFSRLVFNILCGNTDDHARNHAAFWDGKILSLTPAYDICPQNRTGREASQAMQISDDKNLSQVKTCIDAAKHFHLSQNQAQEIVNNQITCIQDNWKNVCEEAELPEVEQKILWGRQFFNPFAFE